MIIQGDGLMLRSLVFLIIGALAGSAAVYLTSERARGLRPGTAPAGPSADSIAPAGPAASAPAAGLPAASDSGFTAARVAVYERAARIDQAAELEREIRRVAGELVSPVRDMELDALLARYLELDPEAAVDLGRRLYFDTRRLEPLFAGWAAQDPEAAIAELAVIEPAARQRQLALAVLGVIGNDAAGVERVAARLPQVDRASFEIDAIVARAERDPAAALQSLLAREQSMLGNLALQRIAEAAVGIDPEGALARAAAIDDYDLRSSFSVAVLDAWARLDPAATFAWLERADASRIPEFAAGIFQTLAAADAERTVDLIETLPPAMRGSAQSQALRSLAEQDLAAALTQLESLPPGRDREGAVQAIAAIYGRQDPEGALAWANSLDGAPQTAVAMVMQGIADTDPSLAYDLVVREIDRILAAGANTRALSSISLMMAASASLGGDFGRVASRLTAIDSPLTNSLLSSAIASWSRNDPQAALNWTLVNAGSLDPRTTAGIGQQLVQQDRALAVSTLDRLAPEQRAGWLEGVAMGLALTDVDGALSLVSRYRGEPGFEAAYAAVANSVARFDPARSANMLSDIGNPQIQRNAVLSVTRQWASRDPAAAAQWVAESADETVRPQAVQIIAQSWAGRDADEARQWLRGLASGPVRDSALDGYLAVFAAGGRFDTQLLEAYSSDAARQRGASRAIVQLGRSDPEEARRLLDTYVTDAAVRRQTEENLERSAGTGNNSMFLSSGGIVIN